MNFGVGTDCLVIHLFFRVSAQGRSAPQLAPEVAVGFVAHRTKKVTQEGSADVSVGFRLIELKENLADQILGDRLGINKADGMGTKRSVIASEKQLQSGAGILGESLA